MGLHSDGCVDKVGSVYVDLSNLTTGMLFHICNANWTSLFKQLGKSVAGAAISQFPLAKVPMKNKVGVWYGKVKQIQGVQYDYIPASQWIQLKAPFPPNDTTIKICYQHAP